MCVRVRLFWRRKCYGLGWNLSWWSHSAHNCWRNIECRKIQKRYSWSYRSALSVTANRWSRLSTWKCKMSRGSCLSRLSEPELNPVDVFVTVKIHQKRYRSCMTHLCTSKATFHKPLSNDWLVLCVGDAKLSLRQEVVTHLTELRKPPFANDSFSLSMICSDNDVEKCCWYCLICYAHMNLNYTIFVDFLSLCKKYCIVSFVD